MQCKALFLATLTSELAPKSVNQVEVFWDESETNLQKVKFFMLSGWEVLQLPLNLCTKKTYYKSLKPHIHSIESYI
jgi:hypothetical protein